MSPDCISNFISSPPASCLIGPNVESTLTLFPQPFSFGTSNLTTLCAVTSTSPDGVCKSSFTDAIFQSNVMVRSVQSCMVFKRWAYLSDSVQSLAACRVVATGRWLPLGERLFYAISVKRRIIVMALLHSSSLEPVSANSSLNILGLLPFAKTAGKCLGAITIVAVTLAERRTGVYFSRRLHTIRPGIFKGGFWLPVAAELAQVGHHPGTMLNQDGFRKSSMPRQNLHAVP